MPGVRGGIHAARLCQSGQAAPPWVCRTEALERINHTFDPTRGIVAKQHPSTASQWHKLRTEGSGFGVDITCHRVNSRTSPGDVIQKVYCCSWATSWQSSAQQAARSQWGFFNAASAFFVNAAGVFSGRCKHLVPFLKFGSQASSAKPHVSIVSTLS